MSRNYLIYTDASADIDVNFVKKKDVKFVPMHYTLGEEDRLCCNMETEELLKQFYDGQRNGKVTSTSQITPFQYVETFEPVLKGGEDVLYLSLSSGLTKTFDSACLAANELKETVPEGTFIPVDSLAATGGMGLLIEAAYKNREAGMTIEENAKWLNDNIHRLCHWFKVEDLMYLKRGGRVPATTAIVGTALNIKPILQIDDEGKLPTIDKKRGSKAAVKALFNLYATKKCEGEEGDRVYICHADCPDDAATLEKMILEFNPKAKITKMLLCPVIGAHVGPGMVAVLHWGNNRK